MNNWWDNLKWRVRTWLRCNVRGKHYWLIGWGITGQRCIFCGKTIPRRRCDSDTHGY